MIIGASRYTRIDGTEFKSGASYVVFGHAGGFPAAVDLALVDKHQAVRVEFRLRLAPGYAGGGDVGAVLLGRRARPGAGAPR